MKYLRDALNILEERGYVEIIAEDTLGSGRSPSPIVCVRPEITEGWK